MKKVFAAAVVLALLLSIAGQAAVYNLSADFAAAANPNGPWSYGGKDRVEGVPVGAFSLATATMSGGLPYGGSYFGWSDGLNGIWKNVDGPGSPYGIGIGQVSISSDSTATSTVRWTAPEDGTIDLAGYFGLGDYGVGHRGVFFNNVQQYMETSTGYSFSATLDVKAGDFIDFTVWDGGYGGNTPVDATITLHVPEPGSLLALAGAIVGMAGLALRKRRV